MTQNEHEHTLEEIAAFIDGRLSDEERSRVMEHLARERGTFMQFMRAGRNVIKKHNALSPEELTHVKSIVSPSLAERLPLIIAVFAVLVFALLLVLFLLPGQGSRKPAGGRETATAGRSGKKKPAKKPPRKTGQKKPGPDAGKKPLPGKPVKRPPKEQIKGLAKVGGAEEQKKVRALIPGNATDVGILIGKLRAALAEGGKAELKRIKQALALGGETSLPLLGRVLLHGYGVEEKLEVLDAMRMMYEWRVLEHLKLGVLWKELAGAASSGIEVAVRKRALELLVQWEGAGAKDALKDAMRAEDEDMRIAAAELLAKSKFHELAVTEFARALHEDQSHAVQTFIIRRMAGLGDVGGDVMRKVREGLSGASGDMAVASAEFLLAHMDSVENEYDKKDIKTEVLGALEKVALAAEPGEGTVDEPLAAALTKSRVTASESAALRAIEMYLKNAGGKVSEGDLPPGDKADKFLASAAASGSPVVKRRAILELVDEKSPSGVTLAIAEIRDIQPEGDAEAGGSVFINTVISRLKSVFNLPAGVADDTKGRTPSESAEILSEWWAEARDRLDEND